MTSAVIMLGPPGAGKGTQAVRLAVELGLPHVSTGDLFRENLSNETDLGKLAKTYMEAGKLVPDDVVIDMLFGRVAADDCNGGYLLDGFPRTVAQAEALSERLADGWTTRTLQLDVPDESLVERASGRLLCKDCGNIHHEKYKAPAAEGVCDACGGELYKRADDNAETVQERLAVYHNETKPLIQYYDERGTLDVVDGSRTPDEVFNDLRGLLSVSGAPGQEVT
ncbi:MAG: adenylate kinase [Planctomycetes bacterium]|nr:adenylate kinase [Planctomycetota bacterium]